MSCYFMLCILCDVTYLHTVKKKRKSNFLLVPLPMFPGAGQFLLIIHLTLSFSDLKEPEARNATKQTSSHGLLFYEGTSLHFLPTPFLERKGDSPCRASSQSPLKQPAWGGCWGKEALYLCRRGLGVSRFSLNWMGWWNSEMKYQEANVIVHYATFFSLAFTNLFIHQIFLTTYVCRALFWARGAG